MKFLQYLKQLNEAFTIPLNSDDELEKKLYQKLPKNWVHADRVIRWYRNEKKLEQNQQKLKQTFIDNLSSIVNLFKTYDECILKLKKLKLLGKKIKIQTATKPIEIDPVKDVDRIRRFLGFHMLVSALRDFLHSDVIIDTPIEKYALNDVDRMNIRIIGLSQNLVCWATKRFETTNKFIFQIWRNNKTLGKGGIYGKPNEQTPYCTHSLQHWNEYSNGNSDYQQFWFFERLDNLTAFQKCSSDIENGLGKIPDFKKLAMEFHYQFGDLNNPDIIKIFNHMPYTQAALVCQNDTGGDLLDRDGWSTDFDHLRFGNQVKQIMDKYFEKRGNIIMPNDDIF